MNENLLKLLQRVDTPTACNAIEVAQGKRGFNAFTRGTMLASHTDVPAMVGYARTARIAAVAPPTEAPEVIKARRICRGAGSNTFASSFASFCFVSYFAMIFRSRSHRC